MALAVCLLFDRRSDRALRDGDPVTLSADGVGLFRRGRAWVLAG